MVAIHQCKRCPHEWAQRGETRPMRCPKCGSPYWDKERGQKPLMPRPDMPHDPKRVWVEECQEIPFGISQRVAGLKALIEKAETPIRATELIATAISAMTSPCQEPDPTPLQQSENKRAWAEKLAELRRLGEYDPAGSAEQFAELAMGRKVPNAFARWTEAKKVEWLTGNWPL